MPPWTKLDTRRLTAKQRAGRPDELAHVRAVAHLSDGVVEARQIGETGKEETDGEPTTKFRGRVDPKLVVAKAPAGQRAALAQALRNDYPAKPFAPSSGSTRTGASAACTWVTGRTPGR